MKNQATLSSEKVRDLVKQCLAFGLSAGLLIEQVSPSWAADGDVFQFFQEEAKVVSASRQPVSRRQAPATVYVVTSQDIKDSGAQNIPETLRNVPGVDVLQTRTNKYEVSIRGLNHTLNNRTLVLLDGKSVSNSLFDFITWESIPITLDEIDRIEVVEGPASAVYGASAVDGVINIITKTPQQLNGGKLSYITGERNTQLGRYVYGKQNEKFGYRLGGGWDSMNQFQDADQFASQAGKFDSLLSYRFSDKSDLSVSGGVTSLNSQATSGPTGLYFERGIVSYARTDYHYADTRFKGFWNHGRTNLNEFLFPPNSTIDYDTYDAEIQQSVSLPFHNQAVVGSSYRHNAVRGDALAPGVHEEDLWAAFLEDQWAIMDHWSFDASGRVDRHPYTPIMFSPRGSLIYNPVPEQVFRVSAGTAFRNPTVAENDFDLTLHSPNPGTAIPYPLFTQINSQIIGNRNLDPERVQSVEISHNGEFGRVKTTVTVFHFELKDTIDSGNTQVTSLIPPTVATQSSYVNDTGALKAWGGEAGVTVVLNRWLTSFANYSYQYLHDDTSLQIVPLQSPRNKANAGLTAKMIGWTGNLWANWVDKTVWASTVEPPNSDDLIAVNSYFLLNAHAGYAFTGRWSGLEVGVAALNFLNHEHYEILPAQSALVPGQNGEIMKSRWTGTVSYKFL